MISCHTYLSGLCTRLVHNRLRYAQFWCKYFARHLTCLWHNTVRMQMRNWHVSCVSGFQVLIVQFINCYF
ncbi:MAG TPA: hypothetical protein DFK12_02590 [Gallionellaceae bacterium]|nr:hypothetical protein [Gallionellaceae bacterium]